MIYYRLPAISMMENDDMRSVAVMIKLRKRKENLEAKIKEKSIDLKKLCIAEAELTGTIPMEIPLEPDESPPRIRRRVGTMYTYTEEFINHQLNNQRVKCKDEGNSPKRKVPLNSWDGNSFAIKPTNNVNSPPHYTWSPQRVSPTKKTQNRSHSYVHKLKSLKKWPVPAGCSESMPFNCHQKTFPSQLTHRKKQIVPADTFKFPSPPIL